MPTAALNSPTSVGHKMTLGIYAKGFKTYITEHEVRLIFGYAGNRAAARIAGVAPCHR